MKNLRQLSTLRHDTAHRVALDCTKSTWSHYANRLNCNKCTEMFCYKHGKEFVSNELVCRRCIVQFLEKYHGISMILRTLKRRLRECGLRRRNEVHLEHEVREIIKREIKVPSSLLSLKTEK